ncbi:MAG: methyltransferase domain-containing protein [Alistipes sp.]|nr:methyltransferase domain-containing protein [Alistipes sp.]
MITLEQYQLLCTEEVRMAIDANISRDALEVALDKRIAHAAEVATQVKYLGRAQKKLPSYYEARCIIPSLAFEQSSSEECAAHKPLSGGSVLDLTCGLGVDALYLSRKFERVVTIERNEVLAEVARENFRRLGAENIEVVCADSAEFVATCDDHFDWCYADPDRRGAKGEKLVRLEDCSPDMVALMPRLRSIAERVCIKASPMFDVEEALRLFDDCSVEVVSLGDECKEVLIYIGEKDQRQITATALGLGSYTKDTNTIPAPPTPEFRGEEYRWLVQPDVALQKCRLARAHLAGKADIWSENGYGFATERPEGVIGRIYEIEQIEPFDPKRLKREMKGQKRQIFKRDFPISTERLTAMTGLKEGGTKKIAFTTIGSNFLSIRLK